MARRLPEAEGLARGQRVSDRYEGIPIVWSTGDIAELAGVVDASVNGWIKTHDGPKPIFVSRRGMTYWSEEDARAVAQGFIDRRALVEERAKLPRTAAGKIKWGSLPEEVRVRHGKPSKPSPKPERKTPRPSRSRVAIAARAADPAVVIPVTRPRRKRGPQTKPKPVLTPEQLEDQDRAEKALEWLLSKSS